MTKMKTALIQQNTRNQRLCGNVNNSIKIHSEYSPLSTKKAVLYQFIDNKTDDRNGSDESLVTQEELVASDYNNLSKDNDSKQLQLSNISDQSFLYSCSTFSTRQDDKNNVVQMGNYLNETNNLLPFGNETSPSKSNHKNNVNSVNDDDSRVTGGGHQPCNNTRLFSVSNSTTEKVPVFRKTSRDSNTPRKVSFKIRNCPVSHRRYASNNIKTTTKLNGNKVAELTLKFNEMIKEKDSILNKPKFAKVVEKIQNKSPDSNSSTPSSTLPFGTNIKIVTKVKSSKKRSNLKKKSASESTADKRESSNSRKKVQRIKSDGQPRHCNSIRKKFNKIDPPKYSNNTENVIETRSEEDILKVFVKNSPNLSKKAFLDKIKHFEKSALQPNGNESKLESKFGTLNLKPPTVIKPAIPERKPIIPVKKNNLTITKNLVIRDGKTKIKILKPNVNPNTDNFIESQPHKTVETCLDQSRKENIYDKFKFRTSFQRKSKLQLLKSKESILERSESLDNDYNTSQSSNIDTAITFEEEKIYQQISANLKPNESFLWNSDIVKKDQIYSDIYQIFDHNSTQTCNKNIDVEFPLENVNNKVKFPSNDVDGLSDLIKESTLNTMTEKTELLLGNEINETSIGDENKCKIEAINVNIINEVVKSIVLNVTEAVNSQVIDNVNTQTELQNRTEKQEDDYEPLELFKEITEATSDHFGNLINKTSISLCPLPAVPLENDENIYQCLFELRSHPEGDDCSNHNYEFCQDKILEQRTCGDGDSDDGYEYCKAPEKNPARLRSCSIIQQLPLPQPNINLYKSRHENRKSFSNDSTFDYDKIPSRISSVENEVPKTASKRQLTYTASVNSYDTLNGNENIYDIIKHSDSMSLNNCYESIPSSPHSVVKLRNKGISSQNHSAGKRISFDTVSNFSHSTISSEQKTNSIYGQRSVVSSVMGLPEAVAYGPAASEISLSDRSDDWVDVSEPEDATSDNTIVIVRERARGRKSPTSWSQRVRHQWHKSPRKSDNGGDSTDSDHYYESLHPVNELLGKSSVTDGNGGSHSTQLFFDDDEDFDSFDSDSDMDELHGKFSQAEANTSIGNSLPAPPTSNIYTLTRFASAAGKKMREIKRNLTKSAKKRYSGSSDNTKFPASNLISPKPATSPSLLSRLYEPKILKPKPKVSLSPDNNIYENENFTPLPNEISSVAGQTRPGSKVFGSHHNIYSAASVTLPPSVNYESANQLNLELKNALIEKRLSLSKIPVDIEKTSSPVLENQIGANEMRADKAISRKTYFSFKAKFRRCTSLVADNIIDVPSALKITNSTFYLTDSVDVDSGFSNCSDSGQTFTSSSMEAIQSTTPARKDLTKATINTINDRDSGDLLNIVSNNVINQNPSPVDRNKFKSRPLAPPPPPPPEAGDLKRLFPSFSKKDKRLYSSTSWYAECGLFDAVNQKQAVPTNMPKERPSSTSWYAEVGLYQAGNISSSSSGASSSVSTISPSPPSPPPNPTIHGRFQQEPLYQFYNAAKVESVCREHLTDSDSDGYEEITDLRNGERAILRPSAMALVSPLKGPSRTLWCEIPEVVNSAILSSLSVSQKKLQEAKFELITSEASYLNSLTVLEKYFINQTGFNDENIMTKMEHDILFGTIFPVKKCSELFMNELEECWQDNILLYGLAEIVKKFAEKNFHVYITYCENQIFLVKTLQRLKSISAFSSLLSTLESQSACHGLSLHSFLMLPMQRITRMPLLVDAVLKNATPSDNEYQVYMDTLATLNNFVSQCNEGARNMERIDEMYRISSSIDYPSNLKEPPDLAPTCIRNDITGKLMKPKRWLVRSGEVAQIMWRGDDVSKLTFGKKFNKIPVNLFLFTDILVIARKHSDESYSAFDYCNRSLIEMSPGDVMAQLNVKEMTGKFTMLLTLLENHEKKTVEMLLSCASETDRQRWIEAFSTPMSNNPEETVYEGWDCPQVAAIYPYQPMQPDELPLQEGDVVNVNKKMADGWYHGERIRDGETGWFPGNYTCEIASAHVRARNLRQRYRLLAFSGSYLGQQRKK